MLTYKLAVPAYLEEIQQAMYEKAEKSFSEHRLVIEDWEKVIPALNDKNVVIIPFCGEIKCEERMKELTKVEEREVGPDGQKLPSMGMKSLCIPSAQADIKTPGIKTAQVRTLFTFQRRFLDIY